MTDIKRVVFSVTIVGSGQPDYSQGDPAVSSQQALLVSFPQTEAAGQKYDDFAKISFSNAQIEYIVGTNANVAKSGSWEDGIVAKEVAFYATKPCFIRFNSSDAIQHEIPADVPLIRFARRIERFYVEGVNGPGTLYAWIEG